MDPKKRNKRGNHSGQLADLGEYETSVAIKEKQMKYKIRDYENITGTLKEEKEKIRTFLVIILMKGKNNR